MKTVAFHGIDFELTSIKQSMLNKQGPTQKIHVINDENTFFLKASFSFIITCLRKV